MESTLAAEGQDIALGTLQMESLPGSPDLPPEDPEYKKGETIIEGMQNPAFDGTDGVTPLTYVDFMPRCLGSGYMKGQLPEFADFGTVVEQANQWIESMPQYRVCKCETISKKLSLPDYSLDNDSVIYHMSSHGQNVFLTGLRLWLMPRTDSEQPIQKLSYMSVIPDHAPGLGDTISSLISQQTGFRMTAMQLFQQFNPLSQTIEKLNRQFQLKPIPGSMLSVETVKLLITESCSKLNPEQTCWVETGKTNRLFVYALRIFYIIGEPAFETLGVKDVAPDFIRNTDGIHHRFKFASYNTTTTKASNWLKKQENIQVLNVQTIDVKIDHPPGGTIDFNSERSGHGEMTYEDSCQFVKVLRLFYVQNKKTAGPVEIENKMTLTSRLFVPVRKNQTGKVFESFSKTMQRVIAWLNVTKEVPLSMESVQYPISPDSWGSGVKEDKVDISKTLSSGRYMLTCIRLYFPTEYAEPSADLLPRTQEDEAGWMCVIS